MTSVSGVGFRSVPDEVLATLGRKRQATLWITSFLVLVRVLESNLVAVVPQRVVQGGPRLTIRAPPLVISGFSKVMAWHERTRRGPVHRWLCEMIKNEDASGSDQFRGQGLGGRVLSGMGNDSAAAM